MPVKKKPAAKKPKGKSLEKQIAEMEAASKKEPAVVASLRDCPRFLQIGAYIFEVVPISSIEFFTAGNYGYTDHIQQVIGVHEGCTPQNQANTLLHEVLHAIYWDRAISQSDMHEELMTWVGANGLCAFFIQNPKAMEWIFNSLTFDKSDIEQVLKNHKIPEHIEQLLGGGRVRRPIRKPNNRGRDGTR